MVPKGVMPLSREALRTRHSRLTCVPGAGAWLHFELLFIEFSKDAEGHTHSLRYGRCISAFPFPCASWPQGPPPGGLMGGDVGRQLSGDKTGTRRSHSGQLPATQNCSPLLKTFPVASLMLIHVKPDEGEGE